MVPSAPEARYRNPPPRFASEQKKSNAASELESSDGEQAQSSDEEDEDRCVRVYQVFAVDTCHGSPDYLAGPHLSEQSICVCHSSRDSICEHVSGISTQWLLLWLWLWLWLWLCVWLIHHGDPRKLAPDMCLCGILESPAEHDL